MPSALNQHRSSNLKLSVSRADSEHHGKQFRGQSGQLIPEIFEAHLSCQPPGIEIPSKLNDQLPPAQQHRPFPAYTQTKAEKLALEAAAVARMMSMRPTQSQSIGSTSTPATRQSESSGHDTDRSQSRPSSSISSHHEDCRPSSESARSSTKLTQHVLRAHSMRSLTDQKLYIHNWACSSTANALQSDQADTSQKSRLPPKTCAGTRAAMRGREETVKLILF